MPTPNLGYGKPSEQSIDTVNIWMRSTPWYQQQMKAWGQDPGHPTLTKSQSEQILRMAQQNGVVVDQGSMEVDDHGNFNPVGHKLRNTLIVAGIAAATIATMGAAGAFSGAAGAGSAAGAGGGGAAAAGGGAAAGGAAAGGAAAGAAGAGGAGWAAAGGGLLKALAPSLVGTLGNVFTSVYGTNKQIEASDRAAEAQLQANREQIAQVERQSQRDLAMAEATRHGNYDIFAARERRLGTLGGLIGAGPREVPDYVPIAGGGSGAPSGAASAGGGDPKITGFIADWQKTHAPTEGIAPLADAISKQFPGVSRFMYGQTPSDNELSIGGQKYKVLGGEKTPGAYWYQPGTNDGPAAVPQRRYQPLTLGSFMPTSAPLTPALAATRYTPGTLGYFGA